MSISDTKKKQLLSSLHMVWKKADSGSSNIRLASEKLDKIVDKLDDNELHNDLDGLSAQLGNKLYDIYSTINDIDEVINKIKSNDYE